jgi:hypothetical protein
MKIRRKCVLKGHKYIESINGYRSPYQFCARWFCDGAQPDPHLVEMGILPAEIPDEWRR